MLAAIALLMQLLGRDPRQPHPNQTAPVWIDVPGFVDTYGSAECSAPFRLRSLLGGPEWLLYPPCDTRPYAAVRLPPFTPVTPLIPDWAPIP